MILKIFSLFTAALLFLITDRPLAAEEINTMYYDIDATHYDEDTLVGMTIGELLEKKQIEPGKWYWVFHGPKMSRNNMIFKWYDIMRERKKAYLVDPYYYVHNHRDPTVSIYFKVQSWTAYMFAEREEGTNKKLDLQRIMYLHHDPQPVENPEALNNKMHLDGRKVGFYFFKKSDKDLVEISYDDLPFLKHYYQVEIINTSDSSLALHTYEVYPKVVSYFIYDYYPNGKIKQMIEIGERKENTPDKKIYMRVVTAKYEDGNEIPPKFIGGKADLVHIYDINHPYWLPNILHD